MVDVKNMTKKARVAYLQEWLDMIPNIYTPSTLADDLDISEEEIRRHIKNGKLSKKMFKEGTFKRSKEEMDKILEEIKVLVTNEPLVYTRQDLATKYNLAYTTVTKMVSRDSKLETYIKSNKNKKNQFIYREEMEKIKELLNKEPDTYTYRDLDELFGLKLHATRYILRQKEMVKYQSKIKQGIVGSNKNRAHVKARKQNILNKIKYLEPGKYTVKEVAEIGGTSPTTIRAYLKQGYIESNLIRMSKNVKEKQKRHNKIM